MLSYLNNNVQGVNSNARYCVMWQFDR